MLGSCAVYFANPLGRESFHLPSGWVCSCGADRHWLAPADQAELCKAVAAGTQATWQMSRPGRPRCCVNPSFESPGEGAVLTGTEDRQLRQVGGGQQRGPVRLLRAGAPSAGGCLLQVSYSFNCPGTGVGTTLVLYNLGSKVAIIWPMVSCSS